MRLFQIQETLWIDVDDILQIRKYTPTYSDLKSEYKRTTDAYGRGYIYTPKNNKGKVFNHEEFLEYCEERSVFTVRMKTMKIEGRSSTSSYSSDIEYQINKLSFQRLMDFLGGNLTKK